MFFDLPVAVSPKGEKPQGWRPALQPLLLEVESGLGEIGRAAEVAPVVFVGAEGEDFFTLGSEEEIGVDDGEDALLGEHGKEARGDDVDAGEGEGVERLRGGWLGFGKSRFLATLGMTNL